VSSVTGAAPTRPERPEFGTTLWAVIRGYLWMLLVLFAVSIVIDVSGVVDRRAMLAPSMVLFPHVDWASWTADLIAAGLLCSLAGWLIARTVRDTVNLPVSIALAGLAVAIGATPLVLGFSPGFSVLALVFGTTLGVRDFAIGTSYRLPLTVRARLVIIGGGLLLIALYLLTHPLNVRGVGSGAIGSEGGASATSYGLLELRNTSFADLKILSVSGARVEAGGDVPGMTGEPARPAEGVVVPARQGQWLTLRDCVSSTLKVRYRLFGRTWTQGVVTQGTSVCPEPY
jgi:hypothetical protein